MKIRHVDREVLQSEDRVAQGGIVVRAKDGCEY
jgi:hypothetical protein